MPVRIYDISKKLGLEVKVVLAQAKALGISAAKVPSSSLDKITGGWLEEELLKTYPTLVSKLKPETPNEPVIPPVATVSARYSAPSYSPAPYAPKPAQTKMVFSPPREIIPTPPKAAQPQTSFTTPSQEFEDRVRNLLDQQYPFCALSNIFLFHPRRAHFTAETPADSVQNDYALEFDHLLHRATAKKDVLTIIECKNQFVDVLDEKTWEVQYKGKDGSIEKKNVQDQVSHHAKALRRYVNPLSRGRELKIEAIVVSADTRIRWQQRTINDWLTLFLMNESTFAQILPSFKPSPMRVVQSDLLGLLRLGIPVPELGHPELPNAIAFIERCRRDLDVELFRAFEPTKERWAINGSAGMGKSVLLAYSLFVLTTDRRIQAQGEGRQLVDFGALAAQLNLPPLGQRRIYAFALKEKQRNVLEVLFRRFVDEFSALTKGSDLGIRRPEIRVWNGIIPPDCHVLVLDEAHDLSAAHARQIADWTNEPGQKRYLLIACDRHQKLRLVGRDENIISGISFSLKTKKLRLNYRNPFAVYSASLGLMFRWFAKGGPKVLPTKDDLQNGFGFTVEDYQNNGSIVLSMRNEAHPANSWSDCVSVFPSCQAALARLHPCRFEQKDVLWVRFCDEDEHFNYEELSGFTYHNLNSGESIDLTDKYVKGQDFPIVVIEGFSENMNKWDSPEEEQIMWQRRKELYICASRATAFLFLIPRTGSDVAVGMDTEVQELVRQLSARSQAQDRAWRFIISPATERKRMDVFTDAQETAV
jgi:hypothetical protein